MKLQQVAEQIQEATPNHYMVKQGDIFKVATHNYNNIHLTDEVEVRRVTRMWMQAGRIYSKVEPSITIVKQSDGYDVVSAGEALDIYQLQRGVMRSLANDASESPNYIRQINDIDS